jgi:hypothetical protein
MGDFDSAAPVLRAMATTYPAGHLWDNLDAKACIRGALEIERLRVQVEMGTKHGQAIHEIGSALGLVPGADLHVACLAAVRNLLTILRLTKDFDAALAGLQIPQAGGEYQ